MPPAARYSNCWTTPPEIVVALRNREQGDGSGPRSFATYGHLSTSRPAETIARLAAASAADLQAQNGISSA